MALVTPIGVAVPAFDANYPQLFTFTVQGGDQVVGNILTIVDNATNEIIYSQPHEDYKYQHELPAHTLSNSGYYAFYFQTINVNGDISARSGSNTFRTFTTPTLNFTNIPSTNVIESGSYSFSCEYNQIEGELINTLYFYLYDAVQTQIQVSEMYTSSMNPPITFIHQFGGLVDNERYYVRAVGTTIYNTIVDTGYVEININYAYDGTYFAVTANNVVNSGYVQISNNISEIDGQTWDKDNLPTDPKFVDGNALLLDDGDYLEWADGFSFSNDRFAKQRWWSPLYWGEQNVMSNYSTLEGHEGDGRTYFTVDYKRATPIGELYAKDYVVVKGYVDGEHYLTKVSNFLTPLNNMSQVTSFLQVDGDNVNLSFLRTIGGSELIWNGISDIQFGVVTELVWDGEPSSSNSNYLDFDGHTNVDYNCITDMFWENEEQAHPITDFDDVNAPPAVKYITNVKLKNAIVREFYVTHDVSQPQAYSELPEWDGYTIMRANFDGNLVAGNVNWLLSSVNRIKVKRRRFGAGEQYMTIHIQPIESAYDLSFYYRDYYVPSGYQFEYAMVPCVDDDEQAYFTTTVTTKFDGLFISDRYKTIKLYGNYLIGASADNVLLGLLQPYNKVYPVVIKNPNVQYRTATIQGDVLGLDDNTCQTFELTNETRPIIVDQKRAWDKFLCDGRAKIVKDWNGNIMLAKITTPPSYMYDQTSGNSKPTMTFGITEVGEYDSQSDMYNHGLINAEST